MPLQGRRGLGESLQSRNASMLDLAPSSFRDGEHAYDSEELEGVENIVHHDEKNAKVSIHRYDMLLLIDVDMVVLMCYY